MSLIEFTSAGLYCPKADLYIDPTAPVERALLTHAHGDIIRHDHTYYCASYTTSAFLKVIVGRHKQITKIHALNGLDINGVRIGLIPSGHAAGAAQLRIFDGIEDWLIAGECSLNVMKSMACYEKSYCKMMVISTNFGSPQFSWPDPDKVVDEIIHWSREHDERLVYLRCNAIGIAQLLIEKFKLLGQPIAVHPVIEQFNEVLRHSEYEFPSCETYQDSIAPHFLGKIILVPQSYALPNNWYSSIVGQCSEVKSSFDNAKHFQISDQLDFIDLNHVIENTNPEQVFTTGRYRKEYATYLNQHTAFSAAALDF